MPDIWKIVIDHVLSWPVIALCLGLLFRNPITALLGRIESVKGPGIDISAPRAALAQIELVAPPESLNLKGEIGSTTPDKPIAPNHAASGANHALAEKREAVQAFGTGILIVDEGVEMIKSQLTSLDLPLDSPETGEILVRHLAATQLMVRCERTHRVIFGSQILALHMMNGAVQPEKALMSIFNNARDQEPQFYGSYSFEDWIGFLIKEVTVLEKETGLYAITVYGQSYLAYIGGLALSPRPH